MKWTTLRCKARNDGIIEFSYDALAPTIDNFEAKDVNCTSNLHVCRKIKTRTDVNIISLTEIYLKMNLHN